MSTTQIKLYQAYATTIVFEGAGQSWCFCSANEAHRLALCKLVTNVGLSWKTGINDDLFQAVQNQFFRLKRQLNLSSTLIWEWNQKHFFLFRISWILSSTRDCASHKCLIFINSGLSKMPHLWFWNATNCH